MSMVMFIIGCIAVMVGVVMVAFGIPVNEFSFGNTLIVSGTTLATGGLIVVTLSAVITQLQRIGEGLAGRAPVQPARPAEAFEAAAEQRAAPARVPFPAKPGMRGAPVPPVPADLGAEEHPAQSFAPALRNPETPPVTVEDEVSLSPAPEIGEPEQAARPSLNGSGGAGRHELSLDAGWHSPPLSAPPREAPSSYFDSMWPAKPRTAPTGERPAEAKPDMARERESVARASAQAAELRATQSKAAILKSGVVDGMAYTLYVDGSIEAELPQGTLRFASIDELRSHLEKNG